MRTPHATFRFGTVAGRIVRASPAAPGAAPRTGWLTAPGRTLRRALTLALAPALLFTACGSDPVTVTFATLDGDLATFRVVNASGRDVAGLELAFAYRDPAGTIVRIDTVPYRTADGQSAPFVAAGEETIVTQRVPDGARDAVASVLGITYDGDR